jgi:hypothetical protein
MNGNKLRNAPIANGRKSKPILLFSCANGPEHSVFCMTALLSKNLCDKGMNYHALSILRYAIYNLGPAPKVEQNGAQAVSP